MSHLAVDVWCGRGQACLAQGRTPQQEQQEFLWQKLSPDPTQWWDNRPSKPTPRHPHFSHDTSKVALWHRPTWVDVQLAAWDSAVTRPPVSLPSASGQAPLAAQEDDLKVERCKNLCEDGRIADALNTLNLLVQQGCQVHNNLFYRLLKKCIANKDLVLGRRIHALIMETGYERDPFLATHLIGLYAPHGRLDEAMRVFSKVSMPSAHNWAAIIFAYARHGEPAQAVRLYREMRESGFTPDSRIYVAVLKACATARDLVAGKEVHAHILATRRKPEIFVQNGLLDMYAKCGSLEDARRVFDKAPDKDVVTWNAMIAGYAQQGVSQEAFGLYRTMQAEGLSSPSCVTFGCLLQACASVGVGALHEGEKLHEQIEERGLQDDVVLGCSLVNMYAKCGSLERARRVFDRLPERTVVTWTAMIAGYTQQGMGQEALSLYSCMQEDGLSPPDSVAFVCLLQACANVGLGALHQGKQLHAQIEERGFQVDVVLGGSLVNMYAKCGSLEDARNVFDRLQHRNIVTWTAIIACYAQHGMGQEALCLYRSMEKEGLSHPDSVTFLCLLQACATVASLPLGKLLHVQIEEHGMQADVVMGAALVNMYAKCGSMIHSQQVFDSLPERTVEAWGALIGGYTRQGDSDVVFDLLDRMKQEGRQPDGITFLSVLTACSHVGLVEEGQEYFGAMRTDYGISPTIEHYTCMMDLLGRAGHLYEALEMAKTMPFPSNGAVWLNLLGACRKWNNVEIGLQAFEAVVDLDDKDATPYAVMSDIYASAGMWVEAKRMQARRVKTKAWKPPGQSWWTDTGGVLHRFVVGGKKHTPSEDTHARLDQLVPKRSSSSLDYEGHTQ